MTRHDPADLTRFAAEAFQAAGLAPDRARDVAEVLVEGDLMGHDTHGLALLLPYLDSLAAGEMRAEGEPEIRPGTPVAQSWDGRKLPGPWLVRRAIAAAEAAAETFGLGAVAIGRSHHIGCLAAYGPPVAARGRMLVLTSSDPATASVAPPGGTRRIITPNPIAAAWPTLDGPAVLDVSMSITTNGMTARRRAEGTRFPGPWLQDGQGRPTDDPNAFWADPPGALLPLGGIDAGHKGFALGLLVEALTGGLAGLGRAVPPAGWGASVFVLVLDPGRFAGTEAFLAESGVLAEAVRRNPPAPGGEPRLPGDRAMARRARALAEGVSLHPSIPPSLDRIATRFGLTPPAARSPGG
jgi:LDH2 family malate/lactate/ureidoglycolate dehydrogenase